MDINDVINEKDFDNFNGDSGYLIEYFFGKIGNNYTMTIIDILEHKMNLGLLLLSKLWHNSLSTINEYIKLRYIVFKNYKEEVIINENMTIQEQIIDIKTKILTIENDIKNQDEEQEKKFLGYKVERNKNESKERDSNIFKKSKKGQKIEDEILDIESKYGKGNYVVYPQTGRVYINFNKFKYPYKK